MKKLMILGGGPNQIPLIKAAKKNGYYVIVCDFNENAPGVNLADELCLVSIMDMEGVLEAARKSEIDGIISNSEPAMPIVAYIGNSLGLPSNAYETVSAMTNKFKFRTLLKDNHFTVPGFGSAETFNEAKSLFGRLNKPIMIKPAVSSGSRGVAKLESEEQLKTAFEDAQNYSRNNKVILEEYIYNTCSHIVGGDIFVSGGKVVFFGLMSCIRDTVNAPLVPKGEIYPAVLNSSQSDNVKNELSRAVSSLGIKFGAINVEIMIDSQGNPCFIELNPRNGGNCIPEELLVATGFDIFDATVRAAVGEMIDDHHTTSIVPYATYMVSSNKPGILKSVGFSEKVESYIDAYFPDVKCGDMVEPFINADKRLGVLMLRFKSIEERDDILASIEDHIFVEVE